MDTPRNKWQDQPSKIIKKSSAIDPNEITDTDDTDLGENLEGRDGGEIDRDGKFAKKHSYGLGKSHIEKMNLECLDLDSADSCDCMEPQMPSMKCVKPKSVCPPAKSSMHSRLPERLVYAHSYVVWQCYQKAFTPDEALKKGTLFPELWGVYPIPK